MNFFSSIKEDASGIIWNLFINTIASSKLMTPRIRKLIYNSMGLDVSNNAHVSASCFMGNPNVSIDENTFINYNCFFDSFSKITIGKDCLIAMEVMFCTSKHDTFEENGSVNISRQTTGKPINIEDNCWIGARSTILPGVTVHEGCIIAAGAVVNKDCEKFSLYAGIPAKKIKQLK